MRIPHPLLGLRDQSEFVYLGDAQLLNRPDGMQPDALEPMTRYAYERDNPRGAHRELWFHEQGDRSWLVVTRDTFTHEILWVEFADEVARRD
jgi:heterotetrameric sarcosine oxidase delta subunit